MCGMPICLCPEGRNYWDKSRQWMRSVDHIVPKCAGGGDELSNLRIAHRSCNSSAGAKIGNVLLLERCRAEGKVTPWGQTREQLVEMGKVQGKINAAKVFTTEHQSRAGKLGGAAGRCTTEQYSNATRAYWGKKTPEERSEMMRNRWKNANKTYWSSMTAEMRSAEMRRRMQLGKERRRAASA